jgi:hypothetical protein
MPLPGSSCGRISNAHRVTARLLPLYCGLPVALRK